jgi:hypothetical protein
MLEIDKAFLKEGYILGVQMRDDAKRKNFYFRILSIEETHYQYSFGALAAGGSSGWIRPQDSSNRYILDPPQDSLINHLFVGVYPTRAEIYLQYPLDRDKGALVGTRVVGSGQGVFADGIRSPYRNPSLHTELVTIHYVDPAFNAYTPIAATVQIYLYAVQYRVSPVITVLSEEEKKRAKVFGIFGKDLADAPDWLHTKGIEV